MYIYIVTHPKFEGWIKLGRTKNANERLDQYQTNCPQRDFKLEYCIETKYVYNIEVYFDNFVTGNSEWYYCSVGFAIDKINEILNKIEEDPEYLKQKILKVNAPFVMKRNHHVIQYDYHIDDLIFFSIRALSSYTKISYTKLCQRIKKGESVIDIGRFTIIRENHVKHYK